MRRTLPTILLATALAATACGGGASPTGDAGPGEPTTPPAATSPADAEGDGGGPRVVVTTTILGDLVTDLVGEDGEVEVLMQPGQDPHGFSPSARQAASLRDADLVVANGLQLEEALLDVLDAAESDGARVLRVAEQLDPEEFAPAGTDDDHAHEDEDDHAHEDEDGDGDEEHAGEGDDHAHSGPDPHVWYDPVRMADGALLLAEELAAVDDRLDDDEWAGRGQELADRILAAHEEVESVLDAVPDECRTLVTSHDSFGYFAARYDFEVIGTVVPGTSTQVEPSARDFAALAETLREAGVPAIFAETTQPARLAEALAGEVGDDVQVVALFTDSLGEPGSGADTYTGMLRTNAERIADALASC
jgi:zinc/manganese transport system substrate-binding protein